MGSWPWRKSRDGSRPQAFAATTDTSKISARFMGSSKIQAETEERVAVSLRDGFVERFAVLFGDGLGSEFVGELVKDVADPGGEAGADAEGETLAGLLRDG